ncbi:hypothetical protein GWI33_017408 [Rhynchophorus ferrugineus]|uniref:non-specific serine/threonine protein kinase n=1 Tax=Rhynchophorus ferrugineus TaxID=354439 RepID=A0A834IRB4_RHYFE|nr:hypothetical protein GWI33_017408 [Rhynchophorus ferrugineus]
MFNEESPQALQKNEFEALQGIFGNDLKDLRKKAAWNKWTPLNLSISLMPQQGSSGNKDIYVQLDLHIICSDDYPLKRPKILLENEKGMSQASLLTLHQELEEKARVREGTEMIFELCQHIREFLHSHNKPAMKSFYDEMLQKQEEKKLQELQQKQLEKEHVMKEVEERKAMLKYEVQLRKERQRSVSENEFDETSRKRQNSCTENIEEIMCGHNGIVLLQFDTREIERGRCIRHNEPYNILYTGIDKQSGEIMEISQWTKNCDELDHLLKHISSVEQEVNYLTKLKHKNVSSYAALKHEVVDNRLIVYVLKEHVSGTSCKSLFTIPNIKIDIGYLKHIAKGVLTAIDYMHRNNVVHKSLNDSCVFVAEKGIIKVSDFSIHKRLWDILSSVHTNYTKKTDILDFGKFILTLLGHNPHIDDLEIPNDLQNDLYDLLTKCLHKDEKLRYPANKLLCHEFFHRPVETGSPQHVAVELPLERNVTPDIVRNISLGSSTNSQSRISNEFEILEHLGQGAFGDVLKARNKLDGGYYAIKRIMLDPKNKNLKNKIIREVTLLSRLNHENVVRYYNSWIETTIIKGTGDEESTISTTTTESNSKALNNHKKFSLSDDIERLVPPSNNVKISVTFDSKSQAAYDESSEEDDSSDDDDALKPPEVKFTAADSDSDSIVFERGSDFESSSKTSPSTSLSKSANCFANQNPEEIVEQQDHLYIQMEFCEKSTLRTAIDNNLYEDSDRVSRLFREIVEGLVHIHQQGMIHRDLKPVNIFLDSNDHVKIGDFGLATTIAIRSKHVDGITRSQVESLKEDIADESKTGHIGTALYVAPEVNAAVKACYNQKVDIYSLGIILFEMCYPPLTTGTERIKLLSKLRTQDISLPADFSDPTGRATFLIKWLLNHDISKRPTSQELLQSEYIPPPVVEERELQELVRHTLSNPQSKGYRYLISSCFKQVFTPAQDITYDRDSLAPTSSKPLNLYEYVREVCVKIFKQHGGQNLTTPLLIPKTKFYDDVETCVKLITHFGNVVSLPHDLRVGFARYVAWYNINCMRRYAVERVYKEKKIFGFTPREFYECAFDIVNPTKGNLLLDAEILYIVYEIVKELPGIRNKHFIIRLNHTALLKSILLHCGLKDKHEELYRLMSDIKDGKVPKSQMEIFLINKGLSDSMIHLLINFLHTEFEFSKVSSSFQMITKKKSGEASVLAKMALKELKAIASHAELYGIDFDFVIMPGLIYNIQQYSGMICQFVCEIKRKKKHDSKEVVAVGGRYDSMIAYYRGIMEQTNMITKDIQQSAVGISISLDKLVQAIQREELEEPLRLDPLDTVVCSIGSNELLKEKTRILKYLWSMGIKSCMLEETSAVDVQEQLIRIGVPQAFIFKDSDTIRVKTWETTSKQNFDKFQEKNLSTMELTENLPKIFKLRIDTLAEGTQTNNTVLRSDSKNSTTERNGSEPIVEILLVMLEKISSSAKRRYETQARSQLDTVFTKLTGTITVIGILAESNIVSTLSSYLDFASESKYYKSIEGCISKHQRNRDYIHKICDDIWSVKTRKTKPAIVLYSLSDNFYRLLI